MQEINNVLSREFYLRDTLIVSQDLLGKVLVHETEEGITKGRIVEVEAYIGPHDKASHAYNHRKSKRTTIQYNTGGYVYMYLIYGVYHCMNIVTSEEGKPEVILLRALEPLEGIPLMQKRRNTQNVKSLCNGPGKLCSAMNISMKQYGIDLCTSNSLYIEDAHLNDYDIMATKRINIDYAGEYKDYLWRFVVKNSPYLSKHL